MLLEPDGSSEDGPLDYAAESRYCSQDAPHKDEVATDSDPRVLNTDWKCCDAAGRLNSPRSHHRNVHDVHVDHAPEVDGNAAKETYD